MKCNHCGFEIAEDFVFCPNCGTAANTQPVPPVQPISLNPAADRIIGALRDNLFLAICILISISCGLSLISGSLPLISILTTIFLWIVFSKSRKGIVDTEHLRCVSGTVYASYIINYVLFSMFGVIGVLFAMIFSYAFSFPEIWDEVISELEIYGFGYSDITEGILSISGWVITAVFILVAAIGIIINIFAMRSIHRLAKSVYQGVQTCNPYFEKVNAAKNWLLVFGICSAISAVSSLAGANIASALSGGCSAAATIIASVLVQKYLAPVNQF